MLQVQMMATIGDGTEVIALIVPSLGAHAWPRTDKTRKIAWIGATARGHVPLCLNRGGQWIHRTVSDHTWSSPRMALHQWPSPPASVKGQVIILTRLYKRQTSRL